MGEALHSSRNRFLRGLALGLLAGGCYALSFPPYRVPLLGWPAVGLLLLAVHHATSWRQAVACGALAAGVACTLGYHWIAQTAHDFGLMPWPLAVGAFAVFALIGEINMTLYALFLWWLRRPGSRWPAAWIAVPYTGLELVIPKVFPDVLAHSQIDVPWMASSSALLGQFGLGFVIAWTSLAGVEAALQRRADGAVRRRRVAELCLALATVVALCAYGAVRQNRDRTVTRSLDVVLLQTNIGDPIGLVNQDPRDRVLDSLTTLYVDWTREALEDGPADLVVWPETAFPASPRHGAIYHLQRLAIETGTPIVFGGYDFWRDDQSHWHIYNTLFWIDRQGTVRDRYHKTLLIPIGEAIPFEGRWPQLRRLFPNAGEFTPGNGPKVMDVDGLWMAPLICYELIFPHYVQRSLKLGGEVLLNVSNDYWFGRTVEPQQHLALARMRAYETGRPIIRCTNTGISALIDSRGRITHRTGIWRQESLRGTLDVPEVEWTPYARWGERVLAVLLLTVCAATGLLFRMLSRSSSSHSTGPSG